MLYKYSLSSFILDDDRLLLQLALNLQLDAWFAHHARSQQNPFTMAQAGNTLAHYAVTKIVVKDLHSFVTVEEPELNFFK